MIGRNEKGQFIKGSTGHMGYKHSQESRKKMCESQKRAWKEGKYTTERNKKIGLAMIGEKHWKWKGENCKKKQERNDPLYKNWVLRVKRRDNWKCKMSNKNCSGYCIVHHILPWRDFLELRYKINNGITLCQYHHPKKRDDEQRLIPFFQEMVGSK